MSRAPARLRILHTEASLGWGGQEIRVLTEARGVGRLGHDVLLAAPPESRIYAEAARFEVETLALPIGVGLAAGLTHVINRRSFGWSMELVLDPWQLLLTVSLATGAALVAGVLPAWRASRRPIAEALHAD